MWCLAGSRVPIVTITATPGLVNNDIDINPKLESSVLSFSHFDLFSFTYRGAGGALLLLTVHLCLLGWAIITLAEYGTPTPRWLRRGAATACGSSSWPSARRQSELEKHSRKNYAAVQVAHNRDILVVFIDKDMGVFATAMPRFSDALGRSTLFPPKGLLPAASMPMFEVL